MATDKNAIIVYTDWIDKFEELEDDEAGRLIKHFFRYVNDLNPEAPDKITKISFIDIENSLKRDLKKWEKTLEGRSKAGKASAEARRNRKEQDSTNSTSVESVKKESTKPTDSVNDSVSVSVKETVNDIDTRKKEFYNSLVPFTSKYSSEMVRNFFEYWSEHGENDRKMRFEKQSSFGISRRLSTWEKKESDFSGNKTKQFKGRFDTKQEPVQFNELEDEL